MATRPPGPRVAGPVRSQGPGPSSAVTTAAAFVRAATVANHIVASITTVSAQLAAMVTTGQSGGTPADFLTLFQLLYPSSGALIWVDGQLGNDANAGTAVSPKATIQGAINICGAGNILTVRPHAFNSGYAPHAFAGHSGNANNYIRMYAPTGAKILANGGIAPGSAATNMIGNNANFIAVFGFEYQGLNSSGAEYECGVMMANGAHDVAVWQCFFHDLASHAFAAPGDGGQGWAGSDKVDFCYNRVTRCCRWNRYQASGFSMISNANLGVNWPDGYKNHVIGNVIDNCYTDPNAPNLTPNFITDGNGIIFDVSGGYAGRTLCIRNLTVGMGGRGIHTLSYDHVDCWLNTSCDCIQNLPGTWVGEFSIQGSTDCRFAHNVGAAKVGSNRVGNFESPGTSTWSDTVFLRGTGGSQANDPGVGQYNNINKTAVGPAGFFQNYQPGVYQQTVITDIAGFRPKPAQVVTFTPSATVRNACLAWPDALGNLPPVSGVWAAGAFEASTVANNNAPAMVLYTGIGATVGSPNDVGNGSPPGMTDAKLVEWATQRAPAGLTLCWGPQPWSVGGYQDVYGPGGSLPPNNPGLRENDWYFESMKLKWGAGAEAGTKNWWQRCAQLGIKNVAVSGMVRSWESTLIWGTTWENDAGWGTTGGAAAIAAGPGSAAWTAAVNSAINSPGWPMIDINNWLIAMNAAGMTGGVLFNLENDSVFHHGYPGMPGGQSEAQTRAWVKLRGAQIEKVLSTRMPGGIIYVYYARSANTLNELSFINAFPGQGTDPFEGSVHDSLMCGFAGGVTKVINIDETYYRGIAGFAVGIGTETADGHYNATMFNMNGRSARHSEAKITQSDAERLTTARNFKQVYFYWPTESGSAIYQDPDGQYRYHAGQGEGWSQGFADNQIPVIIREATRWGQDGKQAVYAQTAQQDIGWFNGQSGLNAQPHIDHNQFEASWQQYLVPGVAQSTVPTGAISLVNGGAFSGSTFSTSGATITVGGTCTDPEFAIDHIEWGNDRIGAGFQGSPITPFVIDSAWNVANSSILPKNTSLGRAAWHRTFVTEPIPLSMGVNVLTFKFINTHQLFTLLTLTVTRS